MFLLLVASDIDTVTGKEGFEWRWIFEVTTQFSWDPKLLFLGGSLVLKANSARPLEDLLTCLLPAFSDFFSLPCCISCCSDKETVNFEGIQLSTQGAERQRKDVPNLVVKIQDFNQYLATANLKRTI